MLDDWCFLKIINNKINYSSFIFIRSTYCENFDQLNKKKAVKPYSINLWNLMVNLLKIQLITVVY